MLDELKSGKMCFEFLPEESLAIQFPMQVVIAVVLKVGFHILIAQSLSDTNSTL